jgi:dolichol-phosphate mannosyltransferase
MMRISLIIPLSPDITIESCDIESYRHVLQEQAGRSSVEVVLAGSSKNTQPTAPDGSPTVISVAGDGRVDSLRAGLRAASGEFLVVLDPQRRYPPEALTQIVEGLSSTEADLAIGVPARSRTGTGLRSLWHSTLGLFSRLVLGTSDAFSGLMAIRRSPCVTANATRPPRGSRLVFDLLAWPHESHADVPVVTRPDDRPRLWPFRLDDLRQLKRVLDCRFGTFSRLAQFCMVGASGMVVDLTLYAIFQLAWPLATAGALSIFCALIWNFTLNRRLTFNDARRGSIFRQFLTYALGNALGIAVSLFLRLYLPNHFGFFGRHRLAAAVVGIVVATGISFSMSRWVVFIRRPDVGPASDRAQLTVDTVVP